MTRAPKLIVALGCASLFVLLSGPEIDGQNSDYGTDKRATFVRESWSRLSPKESGDEFRMVQRKATLWKETKSEDDWVKLTDAIHKAADSSDTKSAVTIRSSVGTGAIVKYQTLGQRKRNEAPTTAKTPTDSHESMYIGTYHIWSERNGKVTSDKNAQYEIAKVEEKVVLAEHK